VTFTGAKMNHAGIAAPCATCHTGVAAIGKPPKHIATNAACDACHKSTMTFAGARLNHASVTAPCATCHTGTVALGKPPKHVATNAACDTCHKSTVTFSGARLNHAGITAPCATCHTGTVASGKPQKHIPTTATCDTCHKSTVSFAGARINHATLAAPCATCHNGTTAAGRGAKHFVTTAPCETCHRPAAWSFVAYRHSSALYPNHGASIACTSCHASNAQAVAWKFAAYKPDCAGCHAANFKPQMHPKYLKPTPAYYTVAELRDCTGACHIYADKTLSTVQTRQVNPHRVNGRGW
jgi:ribosomal protein L44E